MTDFRDDLAALAADLEHLDSVEMAWSANSFGDRVLFVELPDDGAVPDDVSAMIADAGLVGVNEAYDISTEAGASSAGPVGDRHEHRFVDPDDSQWLGNRVGDCE